MASLPATTTPTPDASLGQDIRTLRKSRQMSLNDMANALERSVGWLSQVERGLSEPSITDLRRIAELFSLPLNFFFQSSDSGDDGASRHIVRAGQHRSIGRRDGWREELLSPDLGGSFELIRCEFAPGATSPGWARGEPERRPTEEAGYVINGRLQLTIGDDTHLLNPGDSFRLAGQPFKWHNPGREPCVVIWVIAPPVY